MGRMKEQFIKQVEQEDYETETLELYYKNLLLLSNEGAGETNKTINGIKK